MALKAIHLAFLTGSLLAGDLAHATRPVAPNVFVSWGNVLRESKSFSADFDLSRTDSLFDQLLNLVAPASGHLDFAFPDKFDIALKSALSSYQMVTDSGSAFELVKRNPAAAPDFTYYNSLEPTFLGLYSECFSSLQNSEVEFFACFAKAFEIEYEQRDKSHVMKLESRDPQKTHFTEIHIEVSLSYRSLKTLVLLDATGEKSVVTFKNQKSDEGLADKRFYIPWPESGTVTRAN
jgi:hypothetical protein